VETIGLLCMSSTVLAHDIYSDLRDRDGRLSCNGHLPASGETIPADMATLSPDDRFHRCAFIQEEMSLI
jgi:hypothetical protein